MNHLPCLFSEEVLAARSSGTPQVALETAVLTHGLPWPHNLETARQAQAAVRDAGAVPATIALIQGRIQVGLTEAELRSLAQDPSVMKASTRDIAWAVTRNLSAGTTVAATVALARRVGIAVMATGGIGGVHRGVLEHSDISSDLIELSRSPVAVVCCGAKSILDLSRTLEMLETLGVPVVGFNCRQFPAFYARSSGLDLNFYTSEVSELASVVRNSRAAKLPGGILIVQPPPDEFSIAEAELETLVRQAIELAERSGVSGKELTPFLLGEIRKLAGSRITDLNRELILANARLAAEVSVAL